MSVQYVPLHCHTDASLDGAGTVESLVKQAKAIGLSALAMTDHGTLANAVAFWSACDDEEIKPILGMEAYLFYRNVRHHITLLSTCEEGFNNLIYLSSHAYTHRFIDGYPLVTMDDLEKYKAGMFALTGCASSAIHRDREEHGLNYIYDLCDAVGKENVAGELMFVGTHDIWSRPIALARHANLPIVVTNDTHYPCRDQFGAHQAITKARRGFTYNSEQLWLKSADEIFFEGSKFCASRIVLDGLETSLRIADRVVTWDMRADPTLPHIAGVEEILKDELIGAIKLDVAARGQKKRRADRLQYEFHILKEKGFLDYIYILWDIVRWAKNHGIYVGPGRGSGGGSYVLYLLGITLIDPLEHDLLFERFINPSRSDYPDVDVDFEASRRQEVINYAHDKWGAIPIATYSTYSHKSAVHDIARTLTIPKSLEEEAADSATDSEPFEKFLAQHKDATVTYNTMLGQIRHRGKHAAGVIITSKPVPIERASGELVAAWAEGGNSKDLSKVGIVKLDLLSLDALSQLHSLEEMTGDKCPHYKDPVVYDLFCRGDVAGIFQWSGSDGIRNLTMRVAPRDFNELATINGLYRPGALDAGTAENYPDYKKSPRLLHPRIDPLLASTYGVLVFQEQVMSVVAEVIGTGLADAETVRRLISKPKVDDPHWKADMSRVYANFMKYGQKRGFEREFLAELWQEIYAHSRYSFNKSHSFAYTMISYELAYYKVYHRPAFTVVMLQHDSANAQTYIMDAVQNGLTVAMPHVNASKEGYVLKDGTIYLPLSDIKHLGDKAVQSIVGTRELTRPFESYEDFDARIPRKECNSRARFQLERIGAFRGLSGNPASAISKYEEMPVENGYQAQLEVLGYVVPTQNLLKKMEELRRQPVKKGFERFAGFVTKMTDKVSTKGPYRVYHLSPFGSFWVRNPTNKIEVGTFVSGSKSEYGNSNDVKAYRLGGSS